MQNSCPFAPLLLLFKDPEGIIMRSLQIHPPPSPPHVLLTAPPREKACSRSLNNINFFFNGGIITASQQTTFYCGSAPHIGQNVPKWGFKLGLEPIFFAAWRGPTRERMVRSTPPPRSGAEGKFFTPKAYLHTSFCVQKMGDPELSFRLHRVLFCVEHKSTLDYVGLCRC